MKESTEVEEIAESNESEHAVSPVQALDGEILGLGRDMNAQLERVLQLTRRSEQLKGQSKGTDLGYTKAHLESNQASLEKEKESYKELVSKFMELEEKRSNLKNAKN